MSKLFDLGGKVAIVTGAGRGLGREEALALGAAAAVVYKPWDKQGLETTPAIGPKEKPPGLTTPPPRLGTLRSDVYGSTTALAVRIGATRLIDNVIITP